MTSLALKHGRRPAGRWIAPFWRRLRRDYLSTPLDAGLTILLSCLLAPGAVAAFRWAVLDATWSGQTRADCTGGGACWLFVAERLNQFVYGFYPRAEQWRVDLVFAGLGLSLVYLFWRGAPARRHLAIPLAVAATLAAVTLLPGGVAGLTPVPTWQWGGLMVNVLLALSAGALSLPLAVLLALGRRSHIRPLAALCTAYVEVWRALPVVTVLFMGSVMMPLLLPAELNLDKFLRAIIALALVGSAFMAEVVRGSLQGIPAGQTEAAAALGLRRRQILRLVVLPQALRHAIPGLVNEAITLGKNTTLVAIIGLFDLLGSIQAAGSDPAWTGHSLEGYVFAGGFFWLCFFALSRVSLRLERQGPAGR